MGVDVGYAAGGQSSKKGSDVERDETGGENETGGIVDTFAAFVWEPALVKHNAIAAATEAAALVLSVDETVRNPRSSDPSAAGGGGAPRGRGAGRGRGMRR